MTKLKIINLHTTCHHAKHSLSQEQMHFTSESHSDVEPECNATCDNNPTINLNKDDLLNYLCSLKRSFVSFASRENNFKTLLQEDQMELLRRNSVMFTMVSI